MVSHGKAGGLIKSAGQYTACKPAYIHEVNVQLAGTPLHASPNLMHQSIAFTAPIWQGSLDKMHKPGQDLNLQSKVMGEGRRGDGGQDEAYIDEVNNEFADHTRVCGDQAGEPVGHLLLPGDLGEDLLVGKRRAWVPVRHLHANITNLSQSQCCTHWQVLGDMSSMYAKKRSWWALECLAANLWPD